MVVGRLCRGRRRGSGWGTGCGQRSRRGSRLIRGKRAISRLSIADSNACRFCCLSEVLPVPGGREPTPASCASFCTLAQTLFGLGGHGEVQEVLFTTVRTGQEHARGLQTHLPNRHKHEHTPQLGVAPKPELNCHSYVQEGASETLLTFSSTPTPFSYIFRPRSPTFISLALPFSTLHSLMARRTQQVQSSDDEPEPKVSRRDGRGSSTRG